MRVAPLGKRSLRATTMGVEARDELRAHDRLLPDRRAHDNSLLRAHMMMQGTNSELHSTHGITWDERTIKLRA